MRTSRGSAGARTIQPASKCLDFDGVGDGFAVAANAAIDNTWDSGGGAGGWIKPASDGGGDVGRIFDKTGWLIDTSSESGGEVSTRFIVAFSGASGSWSPTTARITLNVWTHILWTYDSDAVGNDPTLYINGSSVAITEALTPVGTRTADGVLGIGNRQSDWNREFDGRLKDLAFWTGGEPTAAEVARFYNNGSSNLDLNNTPGLTAPSAWWRGGDDPSDAIASNIRDQVGVNHATLGAGNPTIVSDAP